MKRSQMLSIAILVLAFLLLVFSFYSTWLETVGSGSARFNIVVFLRNYSVNFGPEAAGIALTVLILDFLNERRSKYHADAQLKEQLIREMQSRHEPTAVSAVEKLRVHGWLEDGSLRGVDLSGARLRSANLYRTDLSGANLGGTQLQGSSLRYVNLTNARNVTDVQLIQVQALMRATMPDGTVYDGRYNLPRDISHAKERVFDVNDPQSMATYLRISPEAYVRGQEWARNHLPDLKKELDAFLAAYMDNEEADALNGSPPNPQQEVGLPKQDGKMGLLVAGALIALVSGTLTHLAQRLKK